MQNLPITQVIHYNQAKGNDRDITNPHLPGSQTEVTSIHSTN